MVPVREAKRHVSMEARAATLTAEKPMMMADQQPSEFSKDFQ
jgi:hypothetical protein